MLINVRIKRRHEIILNWLCWNNNLHKKNQCWLSEWRRYGCFPQAGTLCSWLMLSGSAVWRPVIKRNVMWTNSSHAALRHRLRAVGVTSRYLHAARLLVVICLHNVTLSISLISAVASETGQCVPWLLSPTSPRTHVRTDLLKQQWYMYITWVFPFYSGGEILISAILHCKIMVHKLKVLQSKKY